MIAMLHDVTIHQDKNQICILYGKQAVGNNKACSPFHEFGKGILYQHFCPRINGGRRLV